MPARTRPKKNSPTPPGVPPAPFFVCPPKLPPVSVMTVDCSSATRVAVGCQVCSWRRAAPGRVVAMSESPLRFGALVPLLLALVACEGPPAGPPPPAPDGAAPEAPSPDAGADRGSLLDARTPLDGGRADGALDDARSGDAS